MKRVLIIGAGEDGNLMLQILHASQKMTIAAIIGDDMNDKGIKEADKMGIPTGSQWEDWIHQDIDIIVETTGSCDILQDLKTAKEDGTVVIPHDVIFKDITEIVHLAEENTDLREIKTMLEAIIYSSDEAISVVDKNGIGIMINPAYTKITGLSEEQVIGHSAARDINEGESMHMHVLRTKEPVRGVPMKVGVTDREVIVNVAPVIVDGEICGSVGVLHDVSEIQSLTAELKKAQEIIRNLEATYTFDDITGASPEMNVALQQAKAAAKTDATVLLRGETGTGKEMFAHAIHHGSGRKQEKFIRLNCSTAASHSIEKELFGDKLQKGLLEEADGGSVFLDEANKLSYSLQAKLLRVLAKNEILRENDTSPVHVDVRIIASSSDNLEKAMMNGTFREDLYYRLNRLPIYIPSLKERPADIPVITKHIISKTNREYGRNIQSITEGALKKLAAYSWPGNVRELQNIIGQTMIYMDPDEYEIEEKHLPSLNAHTILREAFLPKKQMVYESLQTAMEEYEKEYIFRVLKQHNHNKTKAANVLNISIRNLYYKLEKYKLEKT